MPTKAKQPCGYPGCRNLTTTARCEQHPKGHVSGTTKERGYSGLHTKWRRMVLNRDKHQCQSCGKPGHVADHIIPIRQFERREDAFTLDNGQTLCVSCHGKKSRREQLGVVADGALVDHMVPGTKVLWEQTSGPPKP